LAHLSNNPDVYSFVKEKKRLAGLEFEMPVNYFYGTVISAHGTGISICRHPFSPYGAGTGRINGNGELAFPV
jgi:hypothetical protein